MKKITILAVLFGMLASCPSWAAVNFSSGASEKKGVVNTVKEIVAEPAKSTIEESLYEEEIEMPIPAAAPKPVVAVKSVVSDPVKETVKVQPAAKAVSTSEPEVSLKYRAIQSQELRVANLKKQLDGETGQLNQMRSSMAESFGLDVKKLEKGEYQFDSKSGKMVEK